LLAHPNDRAPHSHTQISPTLPYSCSYDGGGSQRTDKFSDGNARDRTSFGRRRVALSQRPEYSKY